MSNREIKNLYDLKDEFDSKVQSGNEFLIERIVDKFLAKLFNEKIASETWQRFSDLTGEAIESLEKGNRTDAKIRLTFLNNELDDIAKGWRKAARAASFFFLNDQLETSKALYFEGRSQKVALCINRL